MKAKELLLKLVSIQSVSRGEAEIGEFICKYLSDNGLDPKMHEGNVYCSKGSGKDSLLLTSHMDTVPVCPGWTRNPNKPTDDGGKIFGLGSNDAKGSMAAMMDAIVSLDESMLDGKVFFSATVQEEVTNCGIEQVMKKLPRVGAAVVGEPTGLDICTSMKGLLILKLKAKGRSAHASRPSEGINAIYNAIGDIQRVLALDFPKSHNQLGKPSIAATMISAGTRNNVIPAQCEFTLNIRSTPFYDNHKLLALIEKAVKSDVIVQSIRLNSRTVPEKEKIVLAARSANSAAAIRGFQAMCDLALIDAPGIIMGPGNSAQSHAPDEFIEISQVEKASIIYGKLIKDYFNRKQVKSR